MKAPWSRTGGAATLVLWLLFASGLALRLAMAHTGYGSTDVKRWLFFSALIEKGAYRDLYFNENPLWNHPAPVILFLELVRWLSRGLELPFHVALKLLPALADAGTIVLVGILGAHRFGARNANLLAASYAFSPAAVLVSGFHGNTDAVMTFFLLSSVAWFGRSRGLSALFFGAALSTKYTPLLLVPLFLFQSRDLKEALKFLVIALSPVVLLSIPFVHSFPLRAAANIASYGSIPGAWGLWHIRDAAEMGWLGAFGKTAMMRCVDGLIAWSKPLIVAGVVLLSAVGRRLHIGLVDGVALAMGTFFAFTPGFGVQYVVWLLPFILLASPRPGTAFNFFVSLFLVNAFHEGLRNDAGMINPEVRVTVFALLAWASVVVFLVSALVRAIRTRPAG